jgi:hypothetical protein
MAQAAKLFVIDQLVDRRMIAAHWAVGIAAQIERVDFHRQRVEAEQSANQLLTFA